jgi:hypothetical protein
MQRKDGVPANRVATRDAVNAALLSENATSNVILDEGGINLGCSWKFVVRPGLPRSAVQGAF